MNLKFVNITKSNINHFLNIKIKSEQKKYVASVKETIEDGREKFDNKLNILKGIKYNNNYVGVFLITINNEPFFHKSNKYLPGALLDRLIIDKQYQGLGIGKNTLKEIIVYLNKLGYNKIYTTCVSGKYSPLHFYYKFGFKKTGKILFQNEHELVYNFN